MMVVSTKLSISEIEEVDKVNALTDRVKRRKEELLAATPHLAAERSHLVTESWKETEGDPLDIRKAKQFKKVMEGIPVVIRDGELIVGSDTKYVWGANPPVEFDADYVLETLKDERVTMSGLGTKTAEITEAEKTSLLEDGAYWKGKTVYDAMIEAQREVFGDELHALKEARVIISPDERPTSARVPNHEKVLNKGLNGIIAEAREGLQKLLAGNFSDRDDTNKIHFLQAVIIACEAAINFAHRYAELAKELAGRESDAVRRAELEKIADICQWVPANPARSFHEAVQSLWFIHLGIHMEVCYTSDVPGRMDQFLYPFYKRDLAEGRLSRQEAAELLGCLWVKFAELDVVRKGAWKSANQANQVQLVTIGGVDKDGRDVTNELTYIILEVVRQLKTRQPALYLRCHQSTPEELWMKACEVARDRGDGMPSFLSDRAALLLFAGLGVPIHAARDYVAIGCIEASLAHVSASDKGLILSHAKIFELTLNNGVDPRTGRQLGLATGDPRDFSSFDQLYDAYKRQFDHFVVLGAKAHRLMWQVREGRYALPFNSALLDDCISKGLDFNRGGVRYPQLFWGVLDRNPQNVANSLTAIKKLVFEEKKISMNDLLDACAYNFEGDGREKIRQMCLAAPKYGNDDDYADSIFNDLSLWAQRRLGQEKHALGQNMGTNRGGATVHTYYGKAIGALPDGRKAWESLADGVLSPAQGTDLKGPTAVISSASKVNHLEVSRGTLFNMKLTPSVLQSTEGLRKFVALVKTFFERGGFHLQFNLMGQEVLCEARKHPEQYRDLLVRVAGYSAYFVDLAPEVQDEIIRRTEHTLQ